MDLLKTFEKQGNFLFTYRGQFPVLLFLLSIPFIWFMDYSSDLYSEYYTYFSILLVIIGLLIRFYTIGTTTKGTSGRNTKEQVAEVLNSEGIYSLVRHPLYVGNYFIWIGISCYVFSMIFILLVSLLFWLYYERIMFAEERFLERKFTDVYLDWTANTPAFFPNLSNYKPSTVSFSFKSVLRREYSGVLATVIGFVFIDVLRNYRLQQQVLDQDLIIALFSTLILTLILKLLKRYTNIFYENDRF